MHRVARVGAHQTAGMAGLDDRIQHRNLLQHITEPVDGVDLILADHALLALHFH